MQMIQMIETTLSMGMMGAILPLGLAVAWAKVGGDRFPKLNPETLNEQQRRAMGRPSLSGTYPVISMPLNTGEVLPTDGSRPLPPLDGR
jgi:hypothetical protein